MAKYKRVGKFPKKGGWSATPETTLRDNDSPPRQSRGDRKERRKSNGDPHVPISESADCARERNKRNEMCVLPLLSQLTVSKRRVGEAGTWFREPRQYHISAILDKMVEMLKSSFKPKGRDGGGLIFKKLNNQRRESNRAISKG